MYFEKLIRVGDGAVYGKILNYLNNNCNSIDHARKNLRSEEFRSSKHNVEVEKASRDIIERLNSLGHNGNKVLKIIKGSYYGKNLCCTICPKSNNVINRLWLPNDIIQKIIQGKYYPGLYACYLRHPNIPIGYKSKLFMKKIDNFEWRSGGESNVKSEWISEFKFIDEAGLQESVCVSNVDFISDMPPDPPPAYSECITLNADTNGKLNTGQRSATDSKSNGKLDSKSEVKLDSKSNGKLESKSEVKLGSKSNGKLESKSEVKLSSKYNVKPNIDQTTALERKILNLRNELKSKDNKIKSLMKELELEKINNKSKDYCKNCDHCKERVKNNTVKEVVVNPMKKCTQCEIEKETLSNFTKCGRYFRKICINCVVVNLRMKIEAKPNSKPKKYVGYYALNYKTQELLAEDIYNQTNTGSKACAKQDPIAIKASLQKIATNHGINYGTLLAWAREGLPSYHDILQLKASRYKAQCDCENCEDNLKCHSNSKFIQEKISNLERVSII